MKPKCELSGMDIVEQLRKQMPYFEVYDGAADEIERLRARLAEAKRLLRSYCYDELEALGMTQRVQDTEALLAAGDKP